MTAYKYADQVENVTPILTRKELRRGIILLHCPHCDDTEKMKPLHGTTRWNGKSYLAHKFECARCGGVVVFPKPRR